MSLILAERPAMSGIPYDLSAYVSDEAMARMGYRPDMDPAIERIYSKYRQDSTAAGSAFFLRDLTDLFGRTFDVKFPELKIRQILPVYTGVDAGAEGYRWQQFNRVGEVDQRLRRGPSVGRSRREGVGVAGLLPRRLVQLLDPGPAQSEDGEHPARDP